MPPRNGAESKWQFQYSRLLRRSGRKRCRRTLKDVCSSARKLLMKILNWKWFDMGRSKNIALRAYKGHCFLTIWSNQIVLNLFGVKDTDSDGQWMTGNYNNRSDALLDFTGKNGLDRLIFRPTWKTNRWSILIRQFVWKSHVVLLSPAHYTLWITLR